jgi:glutathione S-transferase
VTIDDTGEWLTYAEAGKRLGITTAAARHYDSGCSATISTSGMGTPAGTLPALIDGDRAIYESLAICEYLAARHGSDLVVAPGEPEQPEFVQWLLYGEATLQAPLSAMARVGRIRNKTPEMQAGIDAVLSDARHSLSMRVKLLEQRLEGRDFLVAGRMTLADISVGYPLNIMGRPHFASLLGPRATVLRGQRSSAPRRSLAWAGP